MPRAKPTRFEWDTRGFIEILNGPRMGAALDETAAYALAVAEGVYAAENKDQGKGPIYYDENFFVRKRRRLVKGGAQVQTREIGNSDPQWVFVEFGLNAGNSGRIYKYRVFGKTMDALESGGAL